MSASLLPPCVVRILRFPSNSDGSSFPPVGRVFRQSASVPFPQQSSCPRFSRWGFGGPGEKSASGHWKGESHGEHLQEIVLFPPYHLTQRGLYHIQFFEPFFCSSAFSKPFAPRAHCNRLFLSPKSTPFFFFLACHWLAVWLCFGTVDLWVFISHSLHYPSLILTGVATNTCSYFSQVISVDFLLYPPPPLVRRKWILNCRFSDDVSDG